MGRRKRWSTHLRVRGAVFDVHQGGFAGDHFVVGPHELHVPLPASSAVHAACVGTEGGVQEFRVDQQDLRPCLAKPKGFQHRGVDARGVHRPVRVHQMFVLRQFPVDVVGVAVAGHYHCIFKGIRKKLKS